MQIDKRFVGKWRITEMEQWDKDYIDLVAPGYITIERDGGGSLKFGAIDADIDCRVRLEDSSGGSDRLEFSLEGEDEGDPVCGRGWAKVQGREMTGRIYFHMGDESGFCASKK